MQHLYVPGHAASRVLCYSLICYLQLEETWMANPADFVFFNQRGLRAGWRFVIFLAILFCLFLLVAFPLRSIARQADNVLRPELQILGEGITFLVLLIACWIMSRIEKRPM